MIYDENKKLSLEEIKSIELNLLIEFDAFCNEHNLKYVLDGGTLLGAMRHKGFIPWDDDIDIAMPFPDFLKFVDLYKKEGKNPNAEILYGPDNPYAFHFGKLVDKRTIVKSTYRVDKSLYSVWIDIFPMYSVDDNDEIAKSNIDKAMKYYSKARWCLCTNFKNPLKKIIHILFNDPMRKYWMSKIYAIILEHEYGSTKRIATVPVVYNKLILAGNDYFEDRIKAEFEGHKFYISKDYDAYLKAAYGNYMELPPEDQRTTHQIEAYWVR